MSDDANTAAAAPSKPRRGRRFLVVAAIAVAALLAFVALLPALLSASWMRGTVRSWMNRSPDHEVAFDDLSLSWWNGMRITGLSVRDARGGGAPFFTARSASADVEWKPLLDKRIVATGFAVDGAVLDLSAPSPESGTKNEPATLPEGTFGLRSAHVPVTITDSVVKFAKGDVRIAKAVFSVRVDEGVLVVDPIDADVNGGKVTGTARIELASEKPSHVLEVHGQGIELDEYMAPLAARVLPLLAGKPGDGKTSGRADVDLHLEASGHRADEMARTLRGDGAASLTDVVLEARTWLTKALALTGRDAGRIAIEPVKLPFRIADEKVVLDETELRSQEFLLRVGGSVTLQGALDSRMRVKLARGGDAIAGYAKYLDPDGFVPIRVTGTVTAPSVGAPDTEDVLDNAVRLGLGDKAKKALDDILRGQQK